jgi:hypothetical protein
VAPLDGTMNARAVTVLSASLHGAVTTGAEHAARQRVLQQPAGRDP